MADIPTLYYFPLRGRGETIRITLSYQGVEWKEVVPEYATLKAGAGGAEFPFGQLPTFTINGFHLAQSDAILRHLGRLFNLYGSSIEEVGFFFLVQSCLEFNPPPQQSKVDEALLGIESIRAKYVELVYVHSFGEEGKKKYAADHISRESVNSRNGGAHFVYLDNLLHRNGGDFVVGKSFTIADIQVTLSLLNVSLGSLIFNSISWAAFRYCRPPSSSSGISCRD